MGDEILTLIEESDAELGFVVARISCLANQVVYKLWRVSNNREELAEVEKDVEAAKLYICYNIVNRDMVWKLGKLQSAYNELQFNVETASPCTNLLKFCWLIFQQHGWVIQQCDAIGRLLHYTKNSLSSPCTSQHKHEQKDKTKTLVKFPDHIFIDFGCNCELPVSSSKSVDRL